MDDGRPDAAFRHNAFENPSDTTNLAQVPSAMQAAVVGANVLRKPPAGKSALVLIDAAKPMQPGKLIKFSELPPRGEPRRYRSGWHEMDYHLTLVPPELVVVSDEPE